MSLNYAGINLDQYGLWQILSQTLTTGKTVITAYYQGDAEIVTDFMRSRPGVSVNVLMDGIGPYAIYTITCTRNPDTYTN